MGVPEALITFSTDPELDAEVRDIDGLYLNPPDKAVVLCVDDNSQVQALDRIAPVLPLRPGIPASRLTMTSAVARPPCSRRWRSPPAGSPTPANPRHCNEEFLTFRKHVAKAYSRTTLHLAVGNCATHQHPDVQAWLAQNPRTTLHVTATSGS